MHIPKHLDLLHLTMYSSCNPAALYSPLSFFVGCKPKFVKYESCIRNFLFIFHSPKSDGGAMKLEQASHNYKSNALTTKQHFFMKLNTSVLFVEC